MKRLVVLVLLSLVAVCLTTTTYSLYGVDSRCDEPYGTVLDVITVASRLFCAVTCRQTPRCQTAVYDDDVNTCTMNNDTMPSNGSTGCGQLLSIVYYWPGFYGDECLADEASECDTGHCIDGLCGCPANLTYQPPRKTCERGCFLYGHTFEEFNRTRLQRHNDKSLDNVTSAEALDACVMETEFTCASVDCYPYSSVCWLSRESILTKPNEIEENEEYIYFHRNCA